MDGETAEGKRSFGLGMKGWFPLASVQRPEAAEITERCVGGVELFVRFAQQDDRRRILDSAKVLGWVEEDHFLDGESACLSPIRRKSSFQIKRISAVSSRCRSIEFNFPFISPVDREKIGSTIERVFSCNIDSTTKVFPSSSLVVRRQKNVLL